MRVIQIHIQVVIKNYKRLSGIRFMSSLYLIIFTKIIYTLIQKREIKNKSNTWPSSATTESYIPNTDVSFRC